MIQVQEININLYDFFETVKKHWKMILCVVIMSTIVSLSTMGIKIFSTPKLYEITMLIEPGVIGAAGGQEKPLDSAGEIDKRIKDKVYKWNLDEDSIKSFAGVDLNFDVSKPKQTNLIKITSVQRKDNVEKGLKLMSDLFVKLVDDNREKIRAKKRQLRANIGELDAAILAKENMIELQKEKLKTLIQKEERLLNTMVSMENNIKELNFINEELKKRKIKPSVKLSGFDAVLHNVNRLQDLQNQYDTVLTEKETLMTINSKQAKKEIRNLNCQKDDLRLAEANVRNIAIYGEFKTEKVISNQKLWFYPVGGVIVGLVIGSFLACLIELRKKYKAVV
ncbi:MAG: hypothetical protein ISS33_07465 [Candidatus Omnitrophica bacterium]|nr:hypothetical protein [Candidatus Omnitrophota bacterium]